MRHAATLTAMLALSCLSGPVRAKESEAPASVWAGCVDNKVSGTAKFMMGPTAARYLTPKVLPAEGIARCSAALDALPANARWERRAALLRSRAKFHVAARDAPAALADLDAIAAIEKPDAAYSRSFAVSVHMLRAMALAEAGQHEAAAAAARKAVQARPFSLRIAKFAFEMSFARPVVPKGEAQLWENLVRLDPAQRISRAVSLIQAGEWPEALADLQLSSPAPGEIGQTYFTLPNVEVRGLPGIPVRGVDVGRAVNAVIAAHLAGRPDLAEMWLAKARTNISTPQEPSQIEKAMKIAAKPEVRLAELDGWSRLIEVAMLAGKGEAAKAADRIEAIADMPLNQTTLALMRTVVAKLPPDAHPLLRGRIPLLEDQWQRLRNTVAIAGFDPGRLIEEIPDHEEVMLANPYRSSVRFLKANGFSVKLAQDLKTADVSFFGNKSNPFAIGEMALLRAAELAVEQGKPAFRIINNSDYVQTSTQTLNGVPIGPSTVSGHSTSLKIEFVETPATSGSSGAIAASEVLAALTPICIKPET